MASRNVERLLNVIMTIGSRSRIDRGQLFAVIPDYAQAASADAAEKMFERDKAAIRELGLPLLTERDAWDESVITYRMDTSAQDSSLDLSDAEYTVLLAASRAWDDTRLGGTAQRVRAKLLGQGIEPDDDLLHRTPRGSLESLPVLTPLLDAVTSGSRVKFRYRTAAGVLADRTVEPWVVGVHGGRWYLLGYDLDRNAERVFRASRLESFPSIGARSTHPRPSDVTLEDALAFTSPEDETQSSLVSIAPYKALSWREEIGASVDAEQLHIPPAPRAAVTRRVRSAARWATLHAPEAWRAELESSFAQVASMHAATDRERLVADAALRPRPTFRRSSSGTDDLSRLISIAAYVMARGEVELDSLAEEFGTSTSELVRDLQVLFLCGDLGTGWEDLIEAEWEDGLVRVRNAETLRRPLRLSAAEATALLAGLAALGPMGPEEQRIVAAARGKLQAMLPETAREQQVLAADPSEERTGLLPAAPDGTFGAEDDQADEDPRPRGGARRAEEVLLAVDAALREHGTLVIRYSPPDRPGTSVRRIRPVELLNRQGATSVLADCELAGSRRQFRVDRVVEILPEGTPSDPGPVEDPASGAVRGREEGGAWIRLEPSALWIADAFDADEFRDHPREGTVVHLPGPLRGPLVDAVIEVAGAAELLAPASLRDTIVTASTLAASRHHAVQAIP